jgi:Uma2 family endonuclease
MLVEEFEELAHAAPETVTLEFINGRLEVKPVPDGNHSEIVMWLVRQCMQHRPELSLYSERGLKTEAYRKGRARVDALLAPPGTFAGDGEWSDPDGVLMAVEVTSHDSDTNQRDRIDKRDGYAAAGIPIYLLIDRDDSTVSVYRRPEDGRYRSVTTLVFGDPVKLPAPVGFTLETEQLKDYAD